MNAAFFSEEEEIEGATNHDETLNYRAWEDFLEMQESERKQPELHEETKTLCMKMFPKLAQRTNLTPEELQTYYQIRFVYIQPYQAKFKTHEEALMTLALALMRAGKVCYEVKDFRN